MAALVHITKTQIYECEKAVARMKKITIFCRDGLAAYIPL